ncbi:peritrophin-55 [Drosophila serrata]|uniref:peritrophin-55 n=1 Tax=Drosophila serrata TaxID=7274 RepID=UPI000A1CF42A|nr:peritrophin-55 [Drosophila serrata]
MAIGRLKEQYHSSPEHSRITNGPSNNMKVFALTLLSLLALSQARMDYKLQCTRNEIGIRWPSYHSNSEYYVCQGVYRDQLTVHCPPGELFTFVLQQCATPAHYIPAPPMDVLPTEAPITMHTIDEEPPMINGHSQHESEIHETHEHHEHHGNHHEHQPEEEEEALPVPATPAPEPAIVDVAKPVPHAGKRPIPVPHKKPTVPVPAKSTAAAPKKPVAAAKKPAPPTPAKAAKKPTPPSKAQKKPASA